MRGDLEQIWWLCAGERTPIPEHSGRWSAAIPVYPPYPYKAGHYPTADAYYDLPPYAATNPSFYHWRYFMIGQERNRYRYMPHVFHGYSGYPEDFHCQQLRYDPGAGERTNGFTEVAAQDGAQSGWSS